MLLAFVQQFFDTKLLIAADGSGETAPLGLHGAQQDRTQRDLEQLNYRSGQEHHADYSAGWASGNGWTVGVGGFVYRQITDDQQNGTTVANNKGRAYAIGLSIKFDNGKGWFLTAKYGRETGVVNRAEGASFRIKALLPF